MPTQPPTGLPPIIVVKETYVIMQRGIETPTYAVQLHPNAEVVQGLSGSYYDIDFRNAESQKSLLFGPKEYVRNEFDADFKASVTSFRKDVLARIALGNVGYRLFVQGSADYRGNDAPQLATLFEANGKDVAFLPMVNGNPNKFSDEPVISHVPRAYANPHLPNLRAAFVQEKLAALGLPSEILEGSVVKSAGDQYRTATMLLYVNWPKNVTSSSK